MTTTVVKPVRPSNLDDLATLFGTSRTTTGCYCMWFLVPAKECNAGWSGGNREALENLARHERQPVGLLAYRDKQPVGWIAAGPRSRFARALRGQVLRDHDPAEDDQVWLVPCFYVRREARRTGVMRTLLESAVDLAHRRGAIAVEGFPLAGDGRHSAGNAFVGVEPLFASCGFTTVARPTAGRVVMRRQLT